MNSHSRFAERGPGQIDVVCVMRKDKHLGLFRKFAEYPQCGGRAVVVERHENVVEITGELPNRVQWSSI